MPIRLAPNNHQHMHARIRTAIGASLFTLVAAAQPGIPDNTFAGDATVVFGNGTDWLYSSDMVVMPNGSVILVGTRSQVAPTVNMMAICAFDAGGVAVDQAYHGEPGRQHWAMAAALQPDGKIIIAGYSFPVGDELSPSIELMRIGTDLELDPSFGNGGVVVTDLPDGIEAAADVAVLADGSIVAAGSYEGDFGSEIILVKYLADGTVDETGFGTDGVAISELGLFTYCNEMVVAANGNIHVSALTFTDTDAPVIVSFNGDGEVNEAFGTNGAAFVTTEAGYAYSTALTIEPEGTLLLGVCTDPVEIHRFTSDGQVGTGLASGGHVSTGQFVDPDQPIKIVAQPDGRILLALTTGDFRWKAMRLLQNGTADASFTNYTSPNVGVPVFMRAVALQEDGKILLGGNGAVNVTSAFAVTRLLNELTVGVDDLSDGQGTLLVYPNPVVDAARFTFTLEEPSSVSIQLVNNAGQLVRTFQGTSLRGAGTHTEALGLSGIESGTYHIILSSGSARTTVRITKD